MYKCTCIPYMYICIVGNIKILSECLCTLDNCVGLSVLMRWLVSIFIKKGELG